ncbi:hypothetical protein STENM327S_00384 [Streptomyces tendae]
MTDQPEEREGAAGAKEPERPHPPPSRGLDAKPHPPP